MTSIISSFIENVHENIDPSYLKEKREIKKNLQQVGLISTAASIASLAVGIFGLALTVSGGLGAIIGLPLILVSLPLGYLAFNTYKLSENMKDIIDNPKEYQRFFGLVPTFDKQKIKKKLEEETFCFSWAAELAAEAMAKSNFSPRFGSQ